MTKTHKNDKGLEVGDKCFFLAYGWMPVPCTIIGKTGQGWSRSFGLELDEKSTGGRTIIPGGWRSVDGAWDYKFTAYVGRVIPRP